MRAGWPWAVLSLWAGLWLLARHSVVGDWRFFGLGARLLGGHAPLSLYADAPDIQIGPIALLAGWPLQPVPIWAEQLVIYALGLGTLALFARSARPVRTRTLLMAGALAIPSWSFVATSGHLDDALAVLFIALAYRSVRRDQPVLTGLLIAGAVGSKPWAIGALPLVFAVRTHRRWAVVAVIGGVLAIWLPFLLADPRTASALGSFRIPTSRTSGLTLLGLGEYPYPSWVRPAQALGGIALGSWAVARQKAWAVPALAFATRVGLDPGAAAYYAGALALAAVLVDLQRRRRWPKASLLVFVGLCGPALARLIAAQRGVLALNSPLSVQLVAVLRVAACIGAAATALGADRLLQRLRMPQRHHTPQPSRA